MSYLRLISCSEFYSASVNELILTTILGVVSVTGIALLFIPHWTAALFVLPMICILYIDLLGVMQWGGRSGLILFTGCCGIICSETLSCSCRCNNRSSLVCNLRHVHWSPCWFYYPCPAALLWMPWKSSRKDGRYAQIYGGQHFDWWYLNLSGDHPISLFYQHYIQHNFYCIFGPFHAWRGSRLDSAACRPLHDWSWRPGLPLFPIE